MVELKAAGFVEYEPNKFGPAARVHEMPKNDLKKAKSVSKKAKSVPKFDPFLKLCEIDLCLIPKPEHKFEPNRRWRMDYAFIDQKIFLEVEGGVWTGGRHTRGKGFIADMEKYNAASALGWTLIRCVPDDLKNGKAITFIKETLNQLKPIHEKVQ